MFLFCSVFYQITVNTNKTINNATIVNKNTSKSFDIQNFEFIFFAF